MFHGSVHFITFKPAMLCSASWTSDKQTSIRSIRSVSYAPTPRYCHLMLLNNRTAQSPDCHLIDCADCTDLASAPNGEKRNRCTVPTTEQSSPKACYNQQRKTEKERGVEKRRERVEEREKEKERGENGGKGRSEKTREARGVGLV